MTEVREEWREIEGYDEYLVSDQGRVFNMKFGRFLTPRVHSAGYLKVALSNKGLKKDLYIHRLVAQAFDRTIGPRTYIRHEDEDKTNNHVSNLTPIRGREKKVRASRRPTGRGQRVRIRETGEEFMNVHDCARRIHGTEACIYRVLKGERKHHLGYTFEYLE